MAATPLDIARTSGTEIEQMADTRRQEFGAMEISRRNETASVAVAEQAKALVQARYIMAMQRPRDIEIVRLNMLRECKRPKFAKAAIYNKPIGKGVEGLSIRFAEAWMSHAGNLDDTTITLYDDDQKRIIRQSVTDLEANVTHSKDVTIIKTVERSSLRPGQTATQTRTNSYGKPVYIVEASDDDLLNKEAALVSKALRTNALRTMPGWLKDECLAECKKTQQDQDAIDPDGARRELIEAFDELNVKPAQLAEYLAHSLETVVPAELRELRGLYAAIRDGEATWKAAMDAKHPPKDAPGTSETLKDKLKASATANPPKP